MNEPVKAPGMFLIGLPESTLNLVQSISQKTGQSIPEIVSFDCYRRRFGRLP